ncbi:PIG-L family deacetylase [Phenylobacterium sp.]|uniref:PIG-L deacetylase family protein n=1 Tax=Phenylobacterium sp. TaxID=1871053 RepID=UPI0025E01EA4|nr:PIG-L family deacetylase [Phenylobacterium sp.]
MAIILAIHAHPDDIEHLGAGTLALLAGQGHTLRIVTATAGECGSAGPDLATTGTIRKAEAAAAAAMIGAEYRCAELPDLGVFNDDPSRRRITELVRWSRADIVLTGSPVDYHPDHEAISLLARDACFAASVPNYATGPAAPLGAIPHLYFMDPIGGRDRDGNWVAGDFGVDTGAVFETKAAMLSAHESQHAWVARQHAITDHLASMRAWSQRRGQDFGCDHAEGFRQYRNTPYPRTPRLQDLIGEALRAAS